MAGRLILCATPIGNLDDAPPRLATALGSADVIYAEDTRRTATLLRHLGANVPLRSYFAGNEAQRSDELRARLEAGATVALVTDAGTPAVADPGVSAVQAARLADSDITVVPGASAVTAALAVSGMSADRFVFEGFLPRKGTTRQQRLAAIASETRTAVVFAATQRVGKDLADLSNVCGAERAVAVCRELTKLHEQVQHLTLGEAADYWTDYEPRGEFTLVIEGAFPAEPSLDDALDDVMEAVGRGETLSASVRSVAAAHGVSRRQLYEAALEAGVGQSASQS